MYTRNEFQLSLENVYIVSLFQIITYQSKSVKLLQFAEGGRVR